MIRCSIRCSSASERGSCPEYGITAWSAAIASSSLSISTSMALTGSLLQLTLGTVVVGSPPSAVIFSTTRRVSSSSASANSHRSRVIAWTSSPNMLPDARLNWRTERCCSSNASLRHLRTLSTSMGSGFFSGAMGRPYPAHHPLMLAAR